MLWPNHVVLGNTNLRWLIALGVVVGALAAARLVQRWLAPRLSARAAGKGGLPAECLGTLLARTPFLFLLACALVLGGQLLDLPPRIARYLDLLGPIALILQLAAWGHWGIGLWTERMRGAADKNGAGASRAAVLGFLLRLVLGSLLLLVALDMLGFNITALLASLGIGGVAVALAVQNILGDLFASLSITLDRPFVIGDFIIVDQCLGTVQFIGLKTTRIRSLSGEQIVISNSDLLKSRIRNFKQMLERRVVFWFSIAYSTPIEQVEGIAGTLKDLVGGQAKARFDRCHFLEFSDAGLKFEVVYYVLDPDYNLYMDIQQAVNLGLLRAFRAAGIAFSFPVRTLLLSGAQPPGSSP